MCAYIHIIRITTVFRLQWTRASCVYIILLMRISAAKNVLYTENKRKLNGIHRRRVPFFPSSHFTTTTKIIIIIKKSVSLRKNQVYIKRNFLNLTIRLKIITSRLFLPDFRGEREREREYYKATRVRQRRRPFCAREIFYGLLAPGAEKGNVVAAVI